MTDEQIALYAACRVALAYPEVRIRTWRDRFGGIGVCAWVEVHAHDTFYLEAKLDGQILYEIGRDPCRAQLFARKLREEWDHRTPGYRCEPCERQVRIAHALGRQRALDARAMARPLNVV